MATATTYVTRLLSKLDTSDRVQLVIIAYESGLAPSRLGRWGSRWRRCDGAVLRGDGENAGGGQGTMAR